MVRSVANVGTWRTCVVGVAGPRGRLILAISPPQFPKGQAGGSEGSSREDYLPNEAVKACSVAGLSLARCDLPQFNRLCAMIEGTCHRYPNGNILRGLCILRRRLRGDDPSIFGCSSRCWNSRASRKAYVRLCFSLKSLFVLSSSSSSQV